MNLFVAAYLVVMVPACAYLLYAEGQVSVRRAAYVQFYPAPIASAGPYMGECLRRPEGLYCPQERD